MTRLKKVLLVGTMVLAMGVSTATAFAGSVTPSSGSTNLDTLKTQRLELMKEHMADRVKAGWMTQEQADAMLKWMENNQTGCNGAGGYGTGYGMMGGYSGSGGNGYGTGYGSGYGMMGGYGGGYGSGYGMMGGWNQ